MMHFAWLWVWLLLPLPWLLRRLLPAAAAAEAGALRVPFYAQLERLAPQNVQHSARSRLLRWLPYLVWLLLVGAAARPQWLGQAVEIPLSGRDLMLAVDLSGSMQIPDMKLDGQQVDRLTMIKSVAGEFIEKRKGDRLGLILFGTNAYLQTPLTYDRTTVRTLLQESVIGLAGKATAIGDAIGLAVKRLREHPQQSRVLILLTDGANDAGEVAPLQAAKLAAEAKIKIYTIGVGAERLVVPGFFGNQVVNPSQNLDADALQAIAKETGGKFFRAKNTDELRDIYALLDKLEPTVTSSATFRPFTELYPWPLGLALMLSLLIGWHQSPTHRVQVAREVSKVSGNATTQRLRS